MLASYKNTRLSKFWVAAREKASSLAPLIMSLSLKKQYVVKFSSFKRSSSLRIKASTYLLAKAYPTAIPTPSPATPVEASTPKGLFNSGIPGVFEPYLLKFIKSSLVMLKEAI